MRRIILVAAAAAALLSGQQKKLKPGFNLFSPEQDIQMGKEYAAQVEKEMPLVKDAELNRFFDRIGRRLAATPEAGKWPFTFKVVHDKNINAFALPGGPTFMNTGLISAADNEGQIAGVVAHEISHVVLRHGTNQASKQNLLQIPAMLGGAMAGGGLIGSLAQMGIGLGANSVLLKFSRSAESDADLLGTRILQSAGYNPIDMARFFEKLEGESGGGGRMTEFLSSHPNPGNRVKAVEKEIRYLAPKQYQEPDAGELRRMKDLVAKLGDPPKRQAPGGPSGNPDPSVSRPSTTFKELRGRSASLGHPDNWEAFPNKETGEVTIAPRTGVFQADGRVSIGYGMIVRGAQGRGNLRSDTESMVQEILRGDPGLKVTASAREITSGGQPALLVPMSGPSPYPKSAETVWLVNVSQPAGGILSMIFIAPEVDFAQARPVFEKVIGSVRFAP